MTTELQTDVRGGCSVQRLVSRRSPQQRAQLRTCASCEWVHRGHEGCPKCGFGTYGARWVYGAACYKYEKTQEPWMNKKLASYTSELLAEIESANDQAQRPGAKKTKTL